MILEQMMVTGMAVFCYLVADEKTGEGILIDPAGDHDIIFAAVKKHNCDITCLVNTHGHFDHTSGNDRVIRETGATLCIHEKDAKMLKSISTRVLSRVNKGKGSPKPMRMLRDGDIIKAGSVSLKVIHTPGHTPGGICLYTPGHVFTGDTLFTEGMGRTDLGGGSYKEIMKSITEKILTLPDDTIIWPGHHYGRFPKSTVKEQKRIYMG
ncbi:MAG: MBL fold metallo-hydrolase [Spirochaetota bacterium]